jgi:hypothetical protein
MLHGGIAGTSRDRRAGFLVVKRLFRLGIIE